MADCSWTILCSNMTHKPSRLKLHFYKFSIERTKTKIYFTVSANANTDKMRSLNVE